MQQHNRTLELHKILDMLAAHTSNAMAREMALSLEPDSDVVRVQEELNKTEEALSLAIQFGTPPFYAFQDMRGALRRAQSGGTLSLRELMDIAGVLRQIQALSDWYEHGTGLVKHLEEWFSQLTPLPYLLEKLDRSILSEEELADSASSTLAAIRRKKNQAQQKLRDTLDSMVRKKSIQDCLQDNRVTLRDGRFVLPVKAEHRGAVPGLVHDTSATGQTLFVEPMSVVEANNDIRVLERKEQEEIERIIAELCAECGTWADAISSNHIVCATLDFYFAKANLAADMKAFPPLLSDDGILELKQARHPLIPYQKAVPISFTLGKDRQALIITGPNTGGKTVTLKTAGLLCAMAQCGFLIPADERSEICVFDEFLVDIGDEQSIEQSLSTFSGHMKKITGILELAMPHTLVLLDELGAGTDPAEGAALAVAIIEELRRRGVLLMATTHYAELKVFALETKGVVNASCEFDLETLRPTYKLSVGVPGKSNAFLISEKLGIPERVIEAAQQHLSAEDKRLDAVLGQLDDLKLQLKESQNEVEELKNEASHQLEAAQKKRDELIQQGENELEAARAKARALAQQVESQAYALTDELRQLQKDERMSTQQKAQRAREIAKKESEKLFIGTEVVHNPVKEFVPLKEVKVGQEVCIAELNQLATVLSLPDKNGDVLVRAGIIKTKVPLKGLKQPEKLVKETKPQTKAQQRYSRLTGDANRPNGRVERVQRTAKMECNLLGLTVDEALPEVDSFIDRAILNGQTVVYLIHGNGTGALRTAIHKHLRGNRMVKSFRLGRYGEGESGVTVVELK